LDNFSTIFCVRVCSLWITLLLLTPPSPDIPYLPLPLPLKLLPYASLKLLYHLRILEVQGGRGFREGFVYCKRELLLIKNYTHKKYFFSA